MKILWVSNHPTAPSGYGSQTRQVGRRLIDAGYAVEFSANDGARGVSEWYGARVRGSGADRYSRDKVREDLTRSEADTAIVLYDPWVYTEGGLTDPFAASDVRVAGWVPVDHYPVPPSLMPWLVDHTAIAMSRFGFDRLTEASAAVARQRGRGFPVLYAPHAIEKVFRPRDPRPARAALGVPDDAYLVGIVAANTGTLTYDRKGFGDMFQAVAMLMRRHPDVYLYIHSLDRGFQGISFDILARALDMDGDRIRIVDQYRYNEREVDDDEMAALYSSFDVLLATSRGEGFGLPVLEAQACGTPAIVSNWTAQPELVGEVWRPDRPESAKYPSGWVIAVEPDFDPRHAAFFAKPSIGQTIVALEDAYANHRGDQAMRQAAVEKAAGWDADHVFETYWKPVLAELGKPQPATGPNREQRRAAKRKGRAA